MKHQPTVAAPPAVAAPDPSFTPRFPSHAFHPVAATVSPFFSVTPEPPKPNKPPGVLVGPDGVVGSVCCFSFYAFWYQISLFPVGFVVGVVFPPLPDVPGIVGLPFPIPPVNIYNRGGYIHKTNRFS